MSLTSSRPRRKSAQFVWDMVRDDLTLLAYPFIRIAAGIVLLVAMWTMIFDISALEVGTAVVDAGNALIADSGKDPSQNGPPPETALDRKASGEISAVFEHTNFGFLLLFFIINALIGVFTIGAINAQALSLARGDRKGFGYGYAMAVARFPQLIAWWILTIVVGVLFAVVERIRFVGPILALLFGLAWSVLTFFSITAIMATGCGPIAAVTGSKKTIVDCVKKIRGPQSDIDLKTLRVGLRVGGPLLVISSLLVITMMVALFVDFRWVHKGGHGVTAGMIGTLLVVMVINGAFHSALYAVLKSVLYVWAEEDKLAENVDTEVLDNAFIERPQFGLASL